ncbi:MAG: KOW domain-containing RNA-binding protein [Bacillota bacterium]|nr:KOW domain-containing RNA-binding protein [Bacillota bacterium]
MDIVPGQVVYSKAGRDAGKKFIVMDIVDKMFVMISDGDLRKVEKPKKKKIKHLEITEDIAGQISEKLKNKIRIGNIEVRNALKSLEI